MGVSMKMSVQTPYLRKPLDAEINANGKIQRPSARWNREEILGQDLQSKIEVEGQVGLRGEERQLIKEAKKLCQQGQEKCSVLYELAMQRQEARQQLKSSLQKIQGGQAMSI